jgi:hypothetical protein
MFKHFRVKLLVLTLSLISLENLAQETETRKLPHFESITSRANIDVVIAYGEEHAARIETQNIPAEMIVTEVENETLFISLKEGSNWRARAKVNVTLPEVHGICLSSGGNITSESAIKSDHLDIKLTSSGNIDLKFLVVDELDVKLFGTGDMQLGGSADKASIRLTGSGDIQAFGLKTLACQAKITGSGNIKVLAVESIDAHVMGAGDIEYKGNPATERTKSSGPGGITAVN